MTFLQVDHLPIAGRVAHAPGSLEQPPEGVLSLPCGWPS